MDYKTRAMPPKLLCIHRCGVGAKASDIHLAYRDTTRFAAGYYTFGKFPYHFLITREGTIEQCLPLSYNAPAALKSLNTYGIHIALVGDMRKTPASHEQEVALIQLCHLLQNAYAWKLEVRGHTESPGSSLDPNKECPGKKLDLDHLREALDDERVYAMSPELILNTAGVVI